MDDGPSVPSAAPNATRYGETPGSEAYELRGLVSADPITLSGRPP